MKIIIALIGFIFFLIKNNKKLRYALKLDREGKIAERDAFLDPLVTDWGHYVIRLTGKGTKIEVSGQENIPMDSAVVFVGNHQSVMDIPILLGYVNKRKAFISKIEILKVPLLCDWMKLMQCVFLNRKSPRQSVQAMSQAIENVKKGYSLVIFPEGTRSKTGKVAEFKAGSFKLALKAGVPIVPVTINGSRKLYENSGLHSETVYVTIHPAVPTKGLSKEEIATLHDRVRGTIVSVLPEA